MIEGGARHHTLVVPPRELAPLITALPVLPALAASGRHLSVLAPREAAGLLRLSGAEVAMISPQSDHQALRRGGFSEAVFLTSAWRPTWKVLAAGIRPRWGYRRWHPSSLLLSLLLDRAVSPSPDALLKAMGAPPPAKVPPWLVFGEAERQAARLRLHKAHLAPGEEPLVGLYPGAQDGAAAAWPRKTFEAFARELRRRHPSLRLVLLTTAEELWTAVRIFEETGKIHPVIGPDLDLAGLAAVLAELEVFIAGDSWMLHLAAAAGTPCLALLPRGSEAPALAPESRVVSAGRRLAKLPVETVLAAFEALWGNR